MAGSNSKAFQAKSQHLIGTKVNALTVLGFSDTRTKSNEIQMKCLCDCGKDCLIVAGRLRNGTIRSCGCWYRGIVGKRSSHGMSRTRVYSLWEDITTRCYNPKFKQFADWGGRGICMCDGFRAFTTFYAKMGEPPTDKHGPDRIDVDGNYSCGECPQCIENGWPLNVRWATTMEQANNKRNSRFLEYNNESHTIADWGRIRDIHPGYIWKRIEAGWTIGQALGFEPHARRSRWEVCPSYRKAG